MAFCTLVINQIYRPEPQEVGNRVWRRKGGVLAYPPNKEPFWSRFALLMANNNGRPPGLQISVDLAAPPH